jgi:hypothetical protein
MGFKEMKMMKSTEPSVDEVGKGMKKGGKTKMADGGMPMGALQTAMAAAPAMARRRAMPARRPNPRAAMMEAAAAEQAAARPMMRKKGGEVESEAMHAKEERQIKGIKKELMTHEGKPASKAHKGLATGGVINGQGGYKKGGIINTENQGGEYRNTKMDTAKPDHSPAKTGGVKMGNAGGFATGGVAKSNAGGYKKGGKIKGMMDGGMAGDGMMGGGMMDDGMGGSSPYKKGGAAKKFADGGAVQDDGRAVKMPQGNKRPSAPVSINQLSGTFKKGGKVKKFSTGGVSEVEQRLLREAQEEKLDRKGREAFDNTPKVQRELEEAMNPKSMASEMFGKVKNLFSPSKVDVPKGSVTKTEKSVTVTPKKRGGAC